ncbi:MAG: hypothetical protein NTW10_01930 [Bacteroidetes bacterium]|nr:hypothetical protein [Bacteroidota bacterium]
MSRRLTLFGLIVIYFLACGKSCDNNEQFNARQEQEKIDTETKKLITEFRADSLSVTMIQAFEATAVQKFYDYNDYLDILSDTTLATSFRDKTRKMINSLFIPGAEPVKPGRPLSLFRVKIKEGFHPDNDSVYTGRLGFTFVSPRMPVYSDLLIRDSAVIDVFLVKHFKEFGKEKLRVWDVFLGKMNNR